MYNNNISNQHNNIAATELTLPIKRQNRISQLLSFFLPIFKSQPVVAVLRLDGVIGKLGNFKSGLTISSLNKLIEKTFKVNNLDAVCLIINSPGGSPVQAELITNRINRLAKEAKIPVYSFVEDVAASGGYWLACAGDKIFASRSSIIGSIGVISAGFGFNKAIDKLGIERRVYTEGNSKSVLDPFQPEKTSDVKIIKRVQKNIHEHFIDTVKEKRAGCLTQDDDILFNGEFWCGQTALDFGLIDGIEDLYSFIYKNYGKEVKIEYMETKQSWLQKKLGMLSKSWLRSEQAISKQISEEISQHDFTSYEVSSALELLTGWQIGKSEITEEITAGIVNAVINEIEHRTIADKYKFR